MAEDTTKDVNRNSDERQPPFKRGKNHLLLIGIDQYLHVGKLNNAVRDAKAFRDLLWSKYRFEADRTYELYDAQATRKAIRAQLRALASHVKPNDNLLVYFSGHGHYDTLLKEGYWVPVDADYQDTDDYIPYDFLKKIIQAIPSQHTVFIVDSCYSGAVFVRKKDLKPERFERDPSRWMLASGRNEVVPDGLAGGNSPFAEHLLDLLDRYSLEGLRLGTLVERLTTNVTYNSKQTPIGRPMYEVGDKGGEFVFHPKRNQQADYETARQAGTAQALQHFLQAYPDFPEKTELETRIADLRDKEAWEKARRQRTIPSYRNYRREFPHGQYRVEALQGIEDLEIERDWKRARRLDTIAGYERFLDRYPECSQRQEAEEAIERLLKKESVEIKSGNQNRAKKEEKVYETTSRRPETGAAKVSIPLPPMIRVEGGTFLMGSSDTDALGSEKPVRSVTVSSFDLAETAVTFEQFDFFCEQTGRNKPGDDGWGRDNRPVINVGWNDAQDYCRWLRKQTGQHFRLPSEAEWEYAAGGGELNRTKYSGTNGYYKAFNYAVCFEHRVLFFTKTTSPVKSKRPNRLGLYDLSGNVWEWCEDRWHNNYQGAPTNGLAWMSGTSSAHVFRGGSWSNSANECQVTIRRRGNLEHSSNQLGFRLAL